MKGAHVNVLGLTFKENCPDLRNSRVIDVIRELAVVRRRPCTCTIPVADPAEALHEYGVRSDAVGRAAARRRDRRRGRAREFRERPLDDYRRRSSSPADSTSTSSARRTPPRCARGASTCGGCDDADRPLALADAAKALRAQPQRWLVTGSAGFIGSHLVEALLRLDQHVVGLDNFATGYRSNLDEVRGRGRRRSLARHAFVEARHRRLDACRRACEGVDVVLHEAALGSVPRSIADPLATHAANATGFLNMLVAARDAKVQRFVYAASSSTYGDHPGLPKVEDAIGRPLSPYAVTKHRRTSSTPTCSAAATACPRSGCATSTCSARGRIPRARTPR